MRALYHYWIWYFCNHPSLSRCQGLRKYVSGYNQNAHLSSLIARVIVDKQVLPGATGEEDKIVFYAGQKQSTQTKGLHEQRGAKAARPRDAGELKWRTLSGQGSKRKQTGREGTCSVGDTRTRSLSVICTQQFYSLNLRLKLVKKKKKYQSILPADRTRHLWGSGKEAKCLQAPRGASVSG